MNNTKNKLSLKAAKAQDVMSEFIIAVNAKDTIHEVARVFIENNISGAPVLDSSGRPIGVITKTDLARYGLEQRSFFMAEGDKKALKSQRSHEGLPGKGFHLEPEEETLEHWMTPIVFDVFPDTPLSTIVKKMFTLGIHHLFVKDKENDNLVGVITTFDLLKLLSRELN